MHAIETSRNESSENIFGPFALRLPTAALLLLMALSTLLAATVPAQAEAAAESQSSTPESQSAIHWQSYRFEPTTGEPVDAELGTFSVPENRENSESRAIELSFVRFKSTAEKPGSPIVYLAGGPGGSGIDTARGRRFPLFMALRAHADVIAFDQRGTGLSNAIPECDFEETPSLERPAERGWIGELLEREARRCAELWRQQGVDLGGYDTAQSADDLEDLRRALGVPRLSLWGISYGTHLAFAALDRHPESFDRAILASAEGPDETIKLPARTDAYFARVEALLPEGTMPGGLAASLRKILDRLEKEPVIVETKLPGHEEAVKVGIGALDVQLIFSFLISDPSNLQQGLALVPLMVNGDFSYLAPIVARVRSRLSSLSGMSEAMDAASGISAARRRLVQEQSRDAVLGDALNFPMLPSWPLAEWLGVETLPDAFRAAPKSSVPALFLSGSLDGRTYTESHRELAAGFENATFVLIDGAGHNLFMSSEQVEARLLDFLARGKTSAETIHVEAFPGH